MQFSYSKRSFNSEELRFKASFWNLMDKCQAVPGKEPIVLSSYILSDGQGDWSHLQKEAKELSKKFPEREITIIAISAEIHKEKLKYKKIVNVSHHIAYYGDGTHLSPMVDQSPFDDHQKLIQTIKDAGVWLAGPVAIHGIFDSLQNESMSKGFAINEYGFQGNHKNKEFLHKVFLGLGDGELGIYTHESKLDFQWDKIKNNRLKNFLFNTQEVQLSNVESYLGEYVPYMCYVSDDDNAMRFIYRTLYFSYHHARGKKIDIIYPAKTDLTELKENLKHIRFSMASITINDEKIVENKRQGFHLRIINPGQLSKKDFKKVMFLSSPLVGCTGNSSLGQALSFGKIPYYEKLSQTEQTQKNLRNIAAKFCKWDSPLVYLLEPEKRSMRVSDEERNVLENDRLIEDAKHLSSVIKEQYSVKSNLRGMVNAHLCRTKYPQFANAIDNIEQLFLKHEIDLSVACQRINSKLLEIELLTQESV